MKVLSLLPVLTLLATGCGRHEPVSDAYGNFSATEIMVSAQVAGQVLQKNIEEGQRVLQGQPAYCIDTVQTVLSLQETYARQKSISARRVNIQAQLAVLEEQQRILESDIRRFESLVAEGASPQKQLDDLHNQQALLEKQKAQVRTNYQSVQAEEEALQASVLRFGDLLQRARVVCPVSATVLETYAEVGETVAAGRPLFKLAALDTLKFKAFLSANQLAAVALGDTVQILTDDGLGGLRSNTGRISRIASEAEFTPKVIQTREERVALVYAVEIRVPNPLGLLRINMPGEVLLEPAAK